MAALTLLRCTVLFLCLSFCLCQNDCSDVDCPDLDNCIEEVLDSGACCTSCLQKGCTCEGYQYYDCINAGFKNGKVPEGNSYFVDYGSTQCSCPAGGGRISCDFISCPDMPPNCIEVTEPADGCMQCERVGCVFNGQKYEAGHSFHIDSCQVCHCPNEGGELLCYPVQDCNPQKVQNPMLAAPTEEDSAVSSYPYQQGSMDHMDNQEPEDYDYSPTDLPETFHQSVILSTQSSSFSKVIPVSQGPDRTSAHPSSDRQSKLELRERYEVHDHPAGREEVTESPLRIEQATVGPHIPFLDFPTQRDFENPLHTLKSSLPNQGLGSENHREYPHRILESVVDHQTGSLATAHYQNGSESVTPRNAVSQIVSRPGKEAGDQTDQQRQSNSGKSLLYMLKSTETPTQGPVTEDHGDRVDEEEMEDKPVTLHSVLRPEGGDVAHEEILPVQESGSTAPTSSYKKTSSEPATISPGRLNYFTIPTTLFTTTTTTQPPGSFLHSEGEPSSEYQGRMKEQTESKAHPDVFISPDRGPLNPVEDPVQNCCIVGQKWAAENHHCNHMPQLDPDQHSICSVAEKQCCLSAMKESLCELGMISARGGETCEVDLERRCKDDSYQVCCSCCALGLQAHSEGRGCGAHQYLSYPCGHIFLTCCEEETGPSQIPLRRKFMAIPTSLPRKVLDSKFPKEAFSISGTDDAANTVEEKEDVNECQLGLGQLCQHTCTNIWGSYHCGCHQGYILQQDGHSCAPVSPDVRENSPAVIPPQTTTTTTTTSTASTTISSPVHINPCAGKVFYSQCACDGTGLLCASKENGPCSQQCLVVAGKPHCSCFPGFSLMADGHSCEDINECVVQSHNCGVSFVCENTPGSFLCKTKQKCISGFTEDPHGNCIDVNECSSLSKPCNLGFNCINTVGSYSCQKVLMCSQGYHASVDGTKCVDIDECQMGAHRCIGGQICHNLPGSYHCDCQTGYQYDSLRKVCTDINECWRYPGRLCAQTCENTPGSYHCSCTAGFSLAFDGKNCEDVNECDKKPCSQECANIYGSYQCYCRHGYYLHEDGHTCKDIDECSQSMGNLCAYQCVNVAGSYHCSCPPQGYTMSANGHTCNDVDECSSGTHNCSSAHTCYNLQGGFRCLSFDCPHHYKRVSDMRCERTSCPSNSVDCQNSPVRITYYQLSFQTNIIIPAQIFRTGPSPAYPSDHIFIGIIKGNEEGYFSTRKLNSFTGAVYLQRQVREPRDFLIDVEMKLLRQGAFTSFLARIYVFITASTM